MKLTKLCISAMAATLFTGVAVANEDEKSGYLKYNVDNIESRPAQAYDSAEANPLDNRDDLKRRAGEVVPASPHTPYVRTGDDRDDSKNLIDKITPNS